MESFFQFIEVDYRIRKCLASRLEGYANSISASPTHYESTAFSAGFLLLYRVWGS